MKLKQKGDYKNEYTFDSLQAQYKSLRRRIK